MKPYRLTKKIAIKSHGEELIGILNASGVLTDSRLIIKEPGFSAFSMKDGTILEIFGPGHVHPDFLFEKGDVVPSFKVDDLSNTVRHLVAKGIAIPDGIQKVTQTYSYCYARFNSGLVVGFYQEK